MAAGPILKFLDDHDIPHVVVINKMDIGAERVLDVLSALQGCSTRPLVLRQVPIRDGDTVTGYVDLVRERAYRYRNRETSAPIKLPGPMSERGRAARTQLLGPRSEERRVGKGGVSSCRSSWSAN